MNIKLNSYNSKGEKKGFKEIKTSFDKLNLKDETLYQVINSYQANKRQVLSNTKTRAEVSGTGKKPYRQKGTGNARFGSLRTPIHAGGGIAFGPRKNRNFKQKISKKLRNKTLLAILADKNKNSQIFCIESFDLKKPSTKTALSKIAALPLKTGSVLICTPKKDENTYKSLRNVANLQVIIVDTLNPYQALAFDNIIFLDNASDFLSVKNK